MAIGYTKVSGTTYEIGGQIEEWEPIGTYTVTISATSSATTNKNSTISTNIADLSDYSRLRVKLKCTSAGTFTRSASGTVSNWWAWLTNSTTGYTPVCLLVLQSTRSSSGTAFDYSSYSTSQPETGWTELYPAAPRAYLINQKASGPNDYDQGDPGRVYAQAMPISTTTAATDIQPIVIDLNGTSRPLILRTWERGSTVPSSDATAYSGTYSFTFKITLEGMKYKT